MGQQSASRLEGDRFQHLYSFYELLGLLDEGSPYERGYVEQSRAGAADDLSLHAKPGSRTPSRYMQIKWHVDQREAYSFWSLVESGPGETPLLQKLYQSWLLLRQKGPVEIWLVSNWPADPELGAWIDSREWKLHEGFFSICPRLTEAGKEAWRRTLGATRDHLYAFCRDLRLRLGFGGISDLREIVNDRMGRFGLRMGENAQAIASDEVRTWIEVGGEAKHITRDRLAEMITRRALRAAKVDEPPVSLWVHGWARRGYERPPTVELDWTEHFDRASRRVPDQETWDRILFPQLEAARTAFAQVNVSYIDFRGKVPLTTALAIGSAFPEVGGYRFRAEQPTRGEVYLWRSDAGPSTGGHLKTKTVRGNADGQHLVVALAITGEAFHDAERLGARFGDSLAAIAYAEPDNGPSDGAIASDSDACRLAIAAKELIREARGFYGATHTHLILYCPAMLALFQGQRLNAVGNITTYERTEGEGYQRSVRLRTG